MSHLCKIRIISIVIDEQRLHDNESNKCCLHYDQKKKNTKKTVDFYLIGCFLCNNGKDSQLNKKRKKNFFSLFALTVHIKYVPSKEYRSKWTRQIKCLLDFEFGMDTQQNDYICLKGLRSKSHCKCFLCGYGFYLSVYVFLHLKSDKIRKNLLVLCC